MLGRVGPAQCAASFTVALDTRALVAAKRPGPSSTELRPQDLPNINPANGVAGPTKSLYRISVRDHVMDQ